MGLRSTFVATYVCLFYWFYIQPRTMAYLAMEVTNYNKEYCFFGVHYLELKGYQYIISKVEDTSSYKKIIKKRGNIFLAIYLVFIIPVTLYKILLTLSVCDMEYPHTLWPFSPKP